MEALKHEFAPLLPVLQRALPLPAPHVQYAQRWLLAHGLKWEGGSNSAGEDVDDEGRSYIAVHWRRGDRAFSLEMGFGGRLQTIINRPRRFAAFVKQQAARHQVCNVLLWPSSNQSSHRVTVHWSIVCHFHRHRLNMLSSSPTVAAHQTLHSCPGSGSPSAPTSSHLLPFLPLESSPLPVAPMPLLLPPPPPLPPPFPCRIHRRIVKVAGSTAGSARPRWRCRSRFESLKHAAVLPVVCYAPHDTRHTPHVTHHTPGALQPGQSIHHACVVPRPAQPEQVPLQSQTPNRYYVTITAAPLRSVRT